MTAFLSGFFRIVTGWHGFLVRDLSEGERPLEEALPWRCALAWEASDAAIFFGVLGLGK